MPAALPWLVLLGLLALKGNRSGSAWWVWVPLVWVAVCVAAGWHCAEPGIREMRSVPWLQQVLGVLFNVPLALAFGVAALCLLVPRLDCSQRFGTGLRMLVLLAGLSASGFGVAGLWNEGLGEGGLPLLLVPGLAALTVGAAVMLTGLVCRRYRPFRLWLWCSVWLQLLSFVAAVPLYLVAVTVCPFPLDPLRHLVLPLGLFLSAGTFATLLPFLLLVLLNPFFRGRVKALFCLTEAPPSKARSEAGCAGAERGGYG